MAKGVHPCQCFLCSRYETWNAYRPICTVQCSHGSGYASRYFWFMEYLVRTYLTTRRTVLDPSWRRLFPGEIWKRSEDHQLLEHTYIAEQSGEKVLLGESGLFAHVLVNDGRDGFRGVKNYLQAHTEKGGRFKTVRIAKSENPNDIILQAAVSTARKAVVYQGVKLLERPITTKTANVYLDTVRGLVRFLDLYYRRSSDPSALEVLDAHRRAMERIGEAYEPLGRSLVHRLPKWFAERMFG